MKTIVQKHNKPITFSINRLSISDFEQGKSLTLGIDGKLDLEEPDLSKKNQEELKDKFLEFKLATVLRDKIEDKIPTSSTINQKIQTYLVL